MIASPMMIHSQGMPPSVVGGGCARRSGRRGLGEGLGDRTERHDRERVEPVEHHGPLPPTRACGSTLSASPRSSDRPRVSPLEHSFAAQAHRSPRRVAIDAFDRQIGAAAREGGMIRSRRAMPRCRMIDAISVRRQRLIPLSPDAASEAPNPSLSAASRPVSELP